MIALQLLYHPRVFVGLAQLAFLPWRKESGKMGLVIGRAVLSWVRAWGSKEKTLPLGHGGQEGFLEEVVPIGARSTKQPQVASRRPGIHSPRSHQARALDRARGAPKLSLCSEAPRERGQSGVVPRLLLCFDLVELYPSGAQVHAPVKQGTETNACRCQVWCVRSWYWCECSLPLPSFPKSLGNQPVGLPWAPCDYANP